MSSNQITYTFAICTFNRASMVIKCIQSILADLFKYTSFEILIVDNNSTDGTCQILKQKYIDELNVRVVVELTQGLSYARNRACSEAKGSWLIYIDDDAKLHKDYIKRFLWTIENFDFDCFGGMYFAWYPFGQPKWMPKEFGTKTPLRPDVGLIDGSSGRLSGGNFAIKRKVLQDLCGFDSTFGMIGSSIGYGEEDILQKRLFEKGYKVGFDPELKIDHAVLSDKLRLRWHLKSCFYHKKAGVLVDQKRINFFTFGYRILKELIIIIIIIIPKSFFCLLSMKDYYIQNLILDIFQPLVSLFGQTYFTIKYKGVKW